MAQSLTPITFRMAIPTPNHTARQDDAVRALVGEFMEEQKRENTREVAVHAAQQRRSPGLTIFAVIVCASVWLMPLARQEAFLPTTERVDASARMQVFLAAQRVFAYQRQTGTLPADLVQAGVDSAGLTYVRNTDSLFELRTISDGIQVEYRSSMNPAQFLGNTFQVLGSSQ